MSCASLGTSLNRQATASASIDQTITLLNKIPSNPPTPGSNESLTLAILGREQPIDESTKSMIKAVLPGVTAMQERIAMPSVKAQAQRLQHALNGDIGPNQARGILTELRTRIFDELCEREFLYVPPERLRFYSEPMLFGKEVNDRFPMAIDDIEEAGKCLALGRATACVLHAMRIIEVGLRALAKALNIPFAPSWESYLNQISSRIAEKHKNKTSKWKRDEAFYRDLTGDLLLVKQAWRNPTMHIDRKYGVDEAEQILNAAKIFMKRLAEHFTQRDMEKLLK
jgi:HEPN domain-containing protein